MSRRGSIARPARTGAQGSGKNMDIHVPEYRQDVRRTVGRIR
jgi:hypothetical protein